MTDLSDRMRRELEQFFFASVAFEGKELAILGWGSPPDALDLVRASQGRTTATSKLQ